MSERTKVLATAPLLLVSDLQRSLHFYQQKLGFEGPAVHEEPLCFAMLNRNGFDLTLTLAEDGSGVRPNGPTGSWDVYVGVADVGAEIVELTAAGVKIDGGPTDTFYEMREVKVVDPDEHRWCFGQDLTA